MLAALLVVAVAAVAGGGFAIFETVERDGLAKKAETDCDGREKPVAGAPSTLPLGLPLTEGEKVLNVAKQGATTVAFATRPVGVGTSSRCATRSSPI